MTGRVLLALVVAVAAGALIVALADLQPHSREVKVGFNDNAVTDRVATPTQVARLLRAVGARIDRVQVNWTTFEPTPGSYRFAPYDAIYRSDLRSGIRPLFIFAYAPGWAAAPGCDAARFHCPPGPRRFAAAARSAAALAARFPRLAGIEIWNEPNTPFFWAPGADPGAYAALLKACYAAIKRVDPSITVAGASTASTPFSSGGYMRPTDFLAALYRDGAGGDMDAISLHAYPDPGDLSAESAAEEVEAVRSIRDRLGGERTPLWVTETGLSTTGRDAVPDAVQALVLLRLYEKLRDESGVEMVLVHTLIDPPRGAADAETGYGIVRDDLRPKPAYCWLGSAWGGRGC